MRRWQGCLLILASLSLFFLPVSQAFGTTISGKASTVVEWFDDPNEDAAVPIYQYLTINIRDIAGKGYQFKGYGRLGEDATNKVDADSRLYYAYLEKKGVINDDTDVRIGRQFINTAAGASIMDGVFLKFKNVGPVHLSFFGGGDVAYYQGYDEKDFVVGADAAGRFFNGLDLGLSYIQKWGDGELTHEMIGLTGDYDFLDMLNLYTDLQYSWLTDEFTYTLAGMKYHRSSKWSLRTEYLYSLPVFSSTSIYSVFAADEYEELLGELSLNLGTGLRAFGRVIREFYKEYDDANVFEAGIEKIRTDRFSGYLTANLRQDDDGQDTEGVKFRVGYLLSRYLDVGVGIHYDVLERRLDDENDETTAKRFWLDANVYLTKKITLQAKVEKKESDLWKDYYRGRVRLNVKF